MLNDHRQRGELLGVHGRATLMETADLHTPRELSRQFAYRGL